MVLVNTHFDETSSSGVRYTLTMFFTMLRVASSGAELATESAHIGEGVDRTARNMPSLSSASLGGHLVVAAMLIRDEGAGAVVGPFHRPAEHFARVQDADIFGIDRGLHAERAADIAGEHAHLLRPDAENIGAAGSSCRTRPGSGVQRECVALLRRIRPMAARGSIAATTRRVIAQRQLRDMRRLGEGGRDLLAVAVMIVERDIVRHVVVELRRARLRGFARTRSPPAAARYRARPLRRRRAPARRFRATTQATGSPTKRTLSFASAKRAGFFMSEPSRFLNGTRHCSAVVFQVLAGETASTPGIAAASPVSMPLMTPCASRQRTMTA